KDHRRGTRRPRSDSLATHGRARMVRALAQALRNATESLDPEDRSMRRIAYTAPTFVATVALAAALSAGSVGEADVVSTRELCDINWMEFKEVVPGKIDTVLLPTGTLEPHGVINNGADITAPVALARSIAGRINAMIAPVVPYGITGSMDAFPGSFSI